MTITALPSPPDPNNDSDSVFAAKAQAWSLALPQFVTDANALATALNLNSTNDTSTTSNTVGTGSKSFAASLNKSFQPGMYLAIADTAAPSTNSMLVQVTSYSPSTGALVVNVLSFLGSGTKTAWTISQSTANIALVGDSEVTVHTGNGMGSTNTRVRRFTTIQRSVGAAITYADSATLGASFTINASGLYEIYYVEDNTVSTYHGATVNSAELTTAVQSTVVSSRLLLGATTSGAGLPSSPVTRTVRLSAGDVVRPHCGSAFTGTTAGLALFSIRQVGL